MSKVKLLYFIFSIIIPVLLISGCKESINTPENSLEEAELAVFDFDDAFNGIQEGTLEKPFNFNLSLESQSSFRNNSDPGLFGRHLFLILKKLNLDRSQREQVKNFMLENRVCASDAMQKFKEAIEPILEEANIQRKTIIEALSKGEITREQARLQIKELNSATREQIRNSEASQTLKTELCTCKSGLFNSIETILNDEQKIKWERWISLLNGICSED